jgi:hypothetical protein
MGAAEMVARLEQWKERKGIRFEPAPLLREMAGRGTRFYPA